MKRILSLIILGIVFTSISIIAFYVVNNTYRTGERIVYIKEGNIWITDKNGEKSYNLTNRKVENLKNATRISTLWCVDGDKKNCNTVENTEHNRSESYNNDFFEKLSMSPDGEHVSAFGYNNSIKKAIEANKEELNSKYLTGEYWNPQHADLYIFNLRNNKTQVFDLENKFPKGKSLFTNVQIEKVVWSPNNVFLNLITQSGELYRFDITTGKISFIRHNTSFDYRAEWPAYGHMVFTLAERSFYYVDMNRLAYKNDTTVRKYSTYENPLRLLTELVIPNEYYLAGPFSGSKDNNMYILTKKSDVLKIYEYKPYGKRLNLIKEIPQSDFVVEDRYYSNKKVVSPNGEYVILLKKDNSWSLYRLSDMKELISTKTDKNFTPYYLKWSLDGNKFITCNRIVNLRLNKSSMIDTDHCTDSDGSFASDWNYLD